MEKKNAVYTYEFSILNDPYFPEQDYVLVTNNPNEHRMETLINYFHTHNQGVYCCKDAFIVPQITYDNVLKPIFESYGKKNTLCDLEGGEN